ncbi:hypothetical protein N7454_008185 [Penicillium verhagenii]|nr:hypothetical protein N7454_008185 [Penicillium verhagenii]
MVHKDRMGLRRGEREGRQGVEGILKAPMKKILKFWDDKETSTLLVIPSTRALLSHNISHIVLTPNVATEIMNVAYTQDDHEALLRSRTSAFAEDSPASTEASMKVTVMEGYLEDLGPLKKRLDCCALKTARQFALEGCGSLDVEDSEIPTEH